MAAWFYALQFYYLSLHLVYRGRRSTRHLYKYKGELTVKWYGFGLVLGYGGYDI